MSAVLAVEAAHVCESCRLRAAVTTVTVAGAEPFAVCPGCTPVRAAGGSVSDDGESVRARLRTASHDVDTDEHDPAHVEWAGAVRLPVDLADAWVVAGGMVVTVGTALAGWVTAGPFGLLAGGVGSAVVVVGLDLARGRR